MFWLIHIFTAFGITVRCWVRVVILFCINRFVKCTEITDVCFHKVYIFLHLP
ncbi:unnamed protein product [Chondrus crispus]|uniref:Uncharacterized protein n=1 Tax=Chondrus crispus TaxID=2769 RepID=R7Q8L7_CHOCR|nr:unnamed protein product [Chondrus crispus]CDF34374.1 unnamed protein product [Chondrus crispus]|eukprot:XP_005714193.1 unnamed protein product [Chondrus crispus]